MLTEVCQYLKNWFVRKEEDKHLDTFTISGGSITPSVDLLENQYYRIVGSIFNDGVHQYGVDDNSLIDETFDGAIWAMAIPDAVLEIVEDIDFWCEKYVPETQAPYQSESFGGYSYSKATGSSGGAYTWKDAFGSTLSKWRKL